MNARSGDAKKSVVNVVPYAQIPRRVWSYLTGRCRIPEQMRWADCSNAVVDSLVSELHSGVYAINGKSTFKEEFVTCGGVSLNEIDTRTFEARRFPGLYFAGEVLDVDAVTGGFNFQHAWTSAWLAAESISEFLSQAE